MTVTKPVWWAAPENDYRRIADLPATESSSVAVIIPVYNRAASLVRTVAGLVGQTHRDFRVVVVDDGSTEDIEGALQQFTTQLDLELLRQERDGVGAARARNRGAAAVDAAVLLFVDADCIPHPELVERHRFWHDRARNLVVAGTRVHIDASTANLDDITSGRFTPPGKAPRGTTGAIAPEDWRRLFYRRNKQLTLGDIAYRAAVSCNLSMRKDSFDAAGGFSSAFRKWGSEDTELGWRLWNNGMFVIPDNRAIIYHQIQDDRLGQEGRSDARRRSLGLVADLVPHRFYRKTPSPFHTVPKVSWLVRTENADETTRLWRELSQASFPDAEIVLYGPGPAIEHLSSAATSSSKLSLVEGDEGIAAAVTATRGELVALIDGRARIDRRLLARAVTRLERDPRASAVRCAYRLTGNRQYRRLDDLLHLDLSQGRDGFPFFGVIRRRELLKDPTVATSAGDLWTAALDRSRIELLINDHAGIDMDPASQPRLPGPADLMAAGPRETARAGVRVARSIRRRGEAREASKPPPSQPADIRVDYIGFTGKDNLGDEAVLAGVRKLMPWAEIERDLAGAEVLMVGGGTLINGRGYYLTRVLRRDSPDLERVLLGTGVRSPEFWGTTEDMAEWMSFIESAIYAGVRGPDSVGYLKDLGYKDDIDILGDPALALTPPEDTTKVAGRIVVCPVHTAGNLWGQDDSRVFSALVDTISKLRNAGHEIVMMSAFPADDRWLIEIMREVGAGNLTYVPGYADLNDTMKWLASADLVIGERLHASILAAACGTPFVALEYRPKVRDFARSIGMDHQVLRTDDMGRLNEMVFATIARRDKLRLDLGEAVDLIRGHQRTVADQLQTQLTELLR